MTRVAKRQVFTCILISLIVYGLTWCGLSPNVGEPNQVTAFSFGSSPEPPLRNSENYPTQSLLWQDNQSNIAFLQSATQETLNRILIKIPGNDKGALYCHHNIDSNHTIISLHIIDSPDTVLKSISGQTYLQLDIPPPHTLASL